MNIYYITGTSEGLGKAFAEHLLKNESNTVIGISRRCTLKHKNYHHITMDLSDLEKVAAFRFEQHQDAGKICLINNAGILGKVGYAGKLAAEDIIRTFNINLVAPVLLTNSFIKEYQDTNSEKIIVNISSGAGKNPIDGWSTYCSTKAGLDMHARVVDAEQKIGKKSRIRIFSIGPGVVDTSMQENIRKTSKSDFSRIEDFINYKKTGQLATPDLVSSKLFLILDKIDQVDQVVFSVKDY